MRSLNNPSEGYKVDSDLFEKDNPVEIVTIENKQRRQAGCITTYLQEAVQRPKSFTQTSLLSQMVSPIATVLL